MSNLFPGGGGGGGGMAQSETVLLVSLWCSRTGYIIKVINITDIEYLEY
jgi:hypothetical protein